MIEECNINKWKWWIVRQQHNNSEEEKTELRHIQRKKDSGKGPHDIDRALRKTVSFSIRFRFILISNRINFSLFLSSPKHSFQFWFECMSNEKVLIIVTSTQPKTKRNKTLEELNP